MNPLASMNEGSLFSNANTSSFMGKEIELLKYNFSEEDYRNIEVTQLTHLLSQPITTQSITLPLDKERSKKFIWV